MPTLRLQPPSPVFRPSDPTLVRELEDLCRNRIESQEWTRGDVLYVTSDPESQRAWTNLAIGASGKIVRSNGTEPRYSTFTIPDTFTAGSIVYASAANTLAGLAIGSAGQVMGISAGLPAWQTPSVYLAHNLLSATHSDTTAAAPVGGDLIYGTNPASWTRLAIGAAGQVLGVSVGLPAWQTPSVYLAHNLLSATHSDTTAAAVVRGDIITGQAVSPLWKRLALGAAGALLMSDGTDLGYATTLTGTYTMNAVGTALTVTNNVDFNGHMALGANATPASYGVLLLSETGAGDGGSLYGAEIVTTGNAAITIQEAALRVRALTTGAVTIPVVYAGYFDTTVTGATVTNAYGIYVAAVTGATNNYAIRVVPNVNNLISGWLNLGTTGLATAQGALAAGITGGRQCYFNPATSILGVYDSTGTQRIWNDADNIAAGIGAAPGGYRMFALEETGNGDGGSWYGIETLLTANANITVGMHVWRLRAIASGSPTIADVTGARIDLSGLGTATVTTAHAIHIPDWTVGTTKIAVHQVGTNAHSRFQGGATFGADATMTSGFVTDTVGAARVSTGLNVGGTVVPAAGVGIFTAGLSVGADAAPTGGFVGDFTGAVRFTAAPRADYALTAADANLPTFINTPATIPGAQKGWRRINGSAGAQEYVPVWGV